MKNISDISKKILYLIYDSKIKPSDFIKIYKRNNFDIKKTLNFFLSNKVEELKLCLDFKHTNQSNIRIISEKEIYTILKEIEQEKYDIINISENSYPEILKQIHFPPPLLFFKGSKIYNSKFNIAVVGTRKCTSYGKEVAKYICRQLSKIGITIVSGMALGVDRYAHEEAIKESGGSIGILGCGINNIYPPENKFLYKDIIENGSIVSEFFPDIPPLRTNFPARNRIISGLSMGVVVIEAGEKSGAMITSEIALMQNREVFAVPGNIFREESRGCNKLIKNGAKLVEDVDDILEELNQYLCYDLKICNKSNKNKIIYRESEKLNSTINSLGRDQERVFKCIGYKPKSIEEIVNLSNLSINKVISVITELEIKKMIKEKNINNYSRIV
jgi:DNA processing protein